MKKNIVIFIGIITAILISNVLIYAVTNKGKFSFFFAEKNENIVSDILEDDGQSFTIDDYKITLEKSFCESSTQFGYLVFSISKKNGKPEANIDNSGYCNCFGKNDRFSFDLFISGGAGNKYKYEGNILYAYISFDAADFPGEEKKYKIALIDHEQEVDDEGKAYNFNLKFHKKSKSFKFDNGEFNISPLGIRIYSKTKMNKVKVETLNKNSEGEVIVDTSKNIGGFGEHGRNKNGEGYEVIYTYEFKEPKDISDVEYIKLNGERFKVSK